jgi:hypothetical protein
VYPLANALQGHFPQENDTLHTVGKGTEVLYPVQPLSPLELPGEPADTYTFLLTVTFFGLGDG